MKEMCLKIKDKLAIFVNNTKRDLCVAIFKLGRLLSYFYHSSTWRTQLFLRKIGRLYIERAIVIRPAIFLVIFGILGYLIAVRLGSSQIATVKLADFLFAAGAMLGGVIAVVFSFSLFSVQNAADLYSSQFFETYSRDNKEKIVFFAITLITVLFFVTGIAISWEYAFLLAHPRGVAFTFLMLIGVTFVLVDYQFEIVRRKVDPVRAINFLEKKALYSSYAIPPGVSPGMKTVQNFLFRARMGTWMLSGRATQSITANTTSYSRPSTVGKFLMMAFSLTLKSSFSRSQDTIRTSGAVR